MEASIGAETAKLAGLQIDLLQKMRSGQMTLGQLEWFNGLSLEVRNRFAQPDFWAVIRGLSRIVAIEHVIDCDADPFLPENWQVESHKKGGQFEWDPAKVRLHLSPNQQNGKYVQGYKLREELAQEPALNANVLDYLLVHPELIPEEWKGKCIFFWGTVYRDSVGRLFVRYLSWDGGRWYWRCGWLGNDFDGLDPAACSQV